VTAQPATGAGGVSEAADTHRWSGRRWPLFLGLAATIVVVDQLAKAVVTSRLAPGESVEVVGNLVRIVFGQNTGALFGLFKDNAVMFGIVSLIVIGLIVAYHWRAAPTLYLTITLGLLLGGAIGNMVDRLRLGYVVDFVDVGLGNVRFYTFNVADSAISLSILLLLVAALVPSLVEGRHGDASGVDAPPEPLSEAEADAAFWGDDTGSRDDTGPRDETRS
jgi:signal peptidase II